ncbi:MAG: hypothetical protein Q8S33_23410 [Myxococcales bacterium]|nr:hypothetical protein [Myxococcales bacterium]
MPSSPVKPKYGPSGMKMLVPPWPVGSEKSARSALPRIAPVLPMTTCPNDTVLPRPVPRPCRRTSFCLSERPSPSESKRMSTLPSEVSTGVRLNAAVSPEVLVFTPAPTSSTVAPMAGRSAVWPGSA